MGAQVAFTVDSIVAVLAAAPRPLSARGVIEALGATHRAGDVRAAIRDALAANVIIGGNGRDGENCYTVPRARSATSSADAIADVGTSASPYQLRTGDRSPEPEHPEDAQRREIIAATLVAAREGPRRNWNRMTDQELEEIVAAIRHAGGVLGCSALAQALPKMAEHRRAHGLRTLRMRGSVLFLGSGSHTVYRLADGVSVSSVRQADAAVVDHASSTEEGATSGQLTGPSEVDERLQRFVESLPPAKPAEIDLGLSLASGRDLTLRALERALAASSEALAHYLAEVDPDGHVETMMHTRDQARLALDRYLADRPKVRA